jgi:4-hydroxy-3-polyprenylbenzoate decarboxylase
MPDPLQPKSATGLDRRQVLSAAAGLAATLGISASAISPAFAAAKPRRSQLVGPFDSFRDYIKALDERGLLLRVARLDQDQYELAALTYRLIDEFGWYGAPAVLVEEIKQDGRWMKGPVITNHQGHWDTEAIIWGKEPVPGDGPATYREVFNYLYDKMESSKGKPASIPTRLVARDSAPVKEIVLRGDDINLLDFAFIKSNPGRLGPLRQYRLRVHRGS